MSSDLTRKDIALIFARKLVLDNLLTWDLSRFYEFHQTVTEVVVTPKCIEEDLQGGDCPDLYLSLSKLAPKTDTTPPLHVICYVPEGKACYGIYQLMKLGAHDTYHSSDRITYEFFDMPICSDRAPLDVAFSLRAVVHFSSQVSGEPDQNASGISDQLADCFGPIGQDGIYGSGQVCLCGIPDLILSPNEIASAIDVTETALRKLFDNLKHVPLPGALPDSPYRKPKWEYLKSKVRLVESGFRPTMNDLLEGRR
jgi:hypothetical protein